MSDQQPQAPVFHNPERFNSDTGIWRDIIIPSLPDPAKEVEFIDIDSLPPVDSTGLPSFRVAVSKVVEMHAAKLPINNGESPLILTVGVPPSKLDTAAQLAIPAHRMTKRFPNQAEVLADNITESFGQEIVNVKMDGSFINIEFNLDTFNDKVLSDVFKLGDKYGANNAGDGKLVIIDLSSPNIAKQMHVGHLRSTVIGEALRRILQFNGYNVIRDNHVGDWGTQFGLLGRAVELWGNEVKEYLESENPNDQIQGLLKLYVRINQQIAIEKSESEDDTSELENAGREWFVGLERGDKDAVEFWRESSELSMLEFEEVYKKLGSEFEYILGESVYESANQSVISAFKKAGLTFVDEKGVVKVRPSKQKGDALSIQKPDGTSLYGTRDLATIAARMHWFKPERIIYVVGGDQNEYFTNVFDAMHQYLGKDREKLDMVHVSFGAVELPEGPMSTRKGTVVPLRDVISILEDKVRDKVGKSVESRSVIIGGEELEKVIGQVAVGSLIYYDLRGSTKRKIIYDADQVTAFEGNSGASLQYTVTRISSLLENAFYDADATAQSGNWKFSREMTSENALIRRLGIFSDAVKQAAEKYEPSVISEYLVQLASDYNGLLEHTRIVDNPDLEKRNLLLDISAATKQVMINGLRLLNIPIPKVM